MAAHKNGWPRSGGDYNDRWLHNDIREIAYLYVYNVFDEIVNKGEMK